MSEHHTNAHMTTGDRRVQSHDSTHESFKFMDWRRKVTVGNDEANVTGVFCPSSILSFLSKRDLEESCT